MNTGCIHPFVFFAYLKRDTKILACRSLFSPPQSFSSIGPLSSLASKSTDKAFTTKNKIQANESTAGGCQQQGEKSYKFKTE
jgi:hypothetical protein